MKDTVGWIDRSGIYHKCDRGGHADYAKKIIGIEDDFIPEEILIDKGWMKVTLIEDSYGIPQLILVFRNPNQEQKMKLKEWCRINNKEYPLI